MWRINFEVFSYTELKRAILTPESVSPTMIYTTYKKYAYKVSIILLTGVCCSHYAVPVQRPRQHALRFPVRQMRFRREGRHVSRCLFPLSYPSVMALFLHPPPLIFLPSMLPPSFLLLSFFIYVWTFLHPFLFFINLSWNYLKNTFSRQFSSILAPALTQTHASWIVSLFQSESIFLRHLKEEHNCTPEDLEEAEVRTNVAFASRYFLIPLSASITDGRGKCRFSWRTRFASLGSTPRARSRPSSASSASSSPSPRSSSGSMVEVRM